MAAEFVGCCSFPRSQHLINRTLAEMERLGPVKSFPAGLSRGSLKHLYVSRNAGILLAHPGRKKKGAARAGRPCTINENTLSAGFQALADGREVSADDGFGVALRDDIGQRLRTCKGGVNGG